MTKDKIFIWYLKNKKKKIEIKVKKKKENKKNISSIKQTTKKQNEELK